MADEGKTDGAGWADADAVFESLQRLRANPQSFIPILEKRLEDTDESNIMRLTGQKAVKTVEGRAAIEEAIAALKTAKRVRPLMRSAAMDKAANDHVTGTEADNYGHIGTDGSTASDRINRYGKWNRGHGENLGFLHAAPTGDDVIANWLVDDGVADRGHRSNLLRACWHYAGIAAGAHPGPVAVKYVAVFASDFSAPGETPAEEAAEFAASSEGKLVEVDDIVTEINRFRADPKSYIPLLQERRDLIDSHNVAHIKDSLPLMTHEGRAAVEEAIRALEEAEPLSVLEVSAGLTKAAQEHAEDSGKTGSLGHTGTDGSSPGDRANKYGRWRKAYGENLAYFCFTAKDVILSWLIDDGVPARGHRVNLLRDSWTQVGVGAFHHLHMESIYVGLFCDKFIDEQPAAGAGAGAGAGEEE